MSEATPLTDNQNNDCETSLSRLPAEATSKVPGIQKPPRRSAWLDSWLFEWLTLAFSTSCFIAIIVVLWVYDGKVRPEMGHNLNLNTIISVLATGCKSALVLVIGEAISQLKWLWFQDPGQDQGQLVGIQRFDAASRGPLGSLMIIIHHRARSLVSLGAIAIILLLAFEPFMQQVLSYPLELILDENPMAVAYAPQSREFYPTGSLDDGELANAFLQGFFSSRNFNVPPQCSTGNCTWDRFASVGICSRCADITPTLTLDCDLPSTAKSFKRTCSISMPGVDDYKFNTFLDVGEYADPELRLPLQIIWQPINLYSHSIQVARDDEVLQWFEIPNITMAGVKNPLTAVAYLELELNETRISHNGSAPETWKLDLSIKRAIGCSLSTCLRDYSVSMENGAASIQTQNVDFGTIYQESTNTSFIYDGMSKPNNTLCWMPGSSNVLGHQGMRKFAFCDSGMSTLGDVRRYLPTTVDKLKGIPDGSWTDVEDSYTSGNADDAPRMEYFQRVGIEKVMDNIAASLTQFGLEKTTKKVSGRAKVTKVLVSVRWPWIILPAFLVVVAAVFLVATITVSKRSRVPLWKSTALAAYYHGLERLDDDDDHDEYLNTSTMEKDAEREDVRLQPSKKYGKLVLRQQGKSGFSTPIPEPTSWTPVSFLRRKRMD